MKWKNETKTEKIERTFHLPHPYFNKSQGEWENGQLHVIVSQRMSAGSRDFQLQDGMKWSPEILFHFSNDNDFVLDILWLCAIGLLLLCLKRSQILFSKLK